MFERPENDYLLNIMGYQRIQRFLDALKTPLPVTSSALHSFSLATVLNDITINNRQNILEFGCGVSTIVIAKYLQIFDLPGKIYSVEEDKNWVNFLQKKMISEKLEDKVELIFAPIETNVQTQKKWYAADFIERFIAEKTVFDLLIIDGPQAWRPADFEIRKNVPDAVFGLLAEKFSLYLDDTNRKGEARAVKEWSKKHSLKFVELPSKTSVAVRGKRHNFSIL